MSDSELLKGVSAEHVQKLLASSRHRNFSRKEVVFHEGDPGDTLHIVTAGHFAARVTTMYGDVVTLAVLGPGDVFGELALLDSGSARSATVAALERAETRSIHRSDFELLREQESAVTDVLLSILANKVRRLTEQVTEALYVPADVRVLRRLVELADMYESSDGQSTIPLMQEELAGLAGTTRPTTNKVLRREEQRGTISLQRGKTIILDRKALAQRAFRS